jgi:hypothetical protein
MRGYPLPYFKHLRILGNDAMRFPRTSKLTCHAQRREQDIRHPYRKASMGQFASAEKTATRHDRSGGHTPPLTVKTFEMRDDEEGDSLPSAPQMREIGRSRAAGPYLPIYGRGELREGQTAINIVIYLSNSIYFYP